MDTPIRYEFTPHAHALLLLRRDGLPCVFFGDLYGTTGPYADPPTCFGKLPSMVLIRKLYAYGPQINYFERSDFIGWVRMGTEENADGCAVVMSWMQSSELPYSETFLKMLVGKHRAGEVWTDVLDFEERAVKIDGEGFGEFTCLRNGMACFVHREAAGRERFPVDFHTDFYDMGARPSILQNGSTE